MKRVRKDRGVARHREEEMASGHVGGWLAVQWEKGEGRRDVCK